MKVQRSACIVIVRARNDIGWTKYDNAESVWKERLSLLAPPWIRDEIMVGGARHRVDNASEMRHIGKGTYGVATRGCLC